MAFTAKNKKWLGYALYVVLVTLVLLYFLFPAQAVEEAVDNTISRVNPQLGFKADNIVPWIPAGIRMSGARIFMKETPGLPVFIMDNIYIGPHLLQLVKGDYSMDVAGTAYDGAIKGLLHFEGKRGKAFEGELNFKGFDLAEYNFLIEKLKHRVTGKVSGSIVYGKDSTNAGENGKAEMRLIDGQLQLQAPIFGISTVDLQNIDLQLELHDSEITIIKAELSGSEIKASVTGSIRLQPDMKLSQLNLKGTLEPLAEFYKNYPEIRELLKSMKKRVRRGQYSFAVTGTLGEPKFKML